MEWMSKNSGVVVTILIALIVQIGAYAVLMDTVKTLKEMAGKLRSDLDDHEKQSGLHRTADSEARITRIESGINAVGAILTDMKENIGLLRGANHKNN